MHIFLNPGGRKLKKGVKQELDDDPPPNSSGNPLLDAIAGGQKNLKNKKAGHFKFV